MPPTADSTPRAACRALTSAGTPCRWGAMQGEEWCYKHHPGMAAARHASNVLGGMRRKRPDPEKGPPSRLRTIDDAVRELEMALDEVKALQRGTERVRLWVMVARAAIDAHNAHTNEARLDALEAAAGVKVDGQPSGLRRAG